MEVLRNRVSGWSYCAIQSVGGAIAQYIEPVGGGIAQYIESVGGGIAQYSQWVELLRNT